jgi:hypothetical protein
VEEVQDEGYGVHPYPVFGISLSEYYGDGSATPHLWEKMFEFLSQESSWQTTGIFFTIFPLFVLGVPRKIFWESL